jgi:hypothetical protein
MAVFAVGYTVLLKLPMMIINMAAGTTDRYSRKFLLHHSAVVGPEVTGSAFLAFMCSCQTVVCLRMIKRNLRPPVLIMAEPAICHRIIFCLDKTFVEVRVAVRTACTDLPETPLFLFLMAFEARGCGMGSPQGKGAGVMLRHCICERVKPFYSMALRTIRRDSVPGKLAAMII